MVTLQKRNDREIHFAISREILAKSRAKVLITPQSSAREKAKLKRGGVACADFSEWQRLFARQSRFLGLPSQVLTNFVQAASPFAQMVSKIRD